MTRISPVLRHASLAVVATAVCLMIGGCSEGIDDSAQSLPETTNTLDLPEPSASAESEMSGSDRAEEMDRFATDSPAGAGDSVATTTSPAMASDPNIATDDSIIVSADIQAGDSSPAGPLPAMSSGSTTMPQEQSLRPHSQALPSGSSHSQSQPASSRDDDDEASGESGQSASTMQPTPDSGPALALDGKSDDGRRQDTLRGGAMGGGAMGGGGAAGDKSGRQDSQQGSQAQQSVRPSAGDAMFDGLGFSGDLASEGETPESKKRSRRGKLSEAAMAPAAPMGMEPGKLEAPASASESRLAGRRGAPEPAPGSDGAGQARKLNRSSRSELEKQKARSMNTLQEELLTEGQLAGGAKQGQRRSFQMGHHFSLDVLDGDFGMARSPARKKVMQLDLQAGEELWIVAKASNSDAQQQAPQSPRSGALMATVPGQTQQIPVPLKHTSVTGDVDGYIATVDVTQQFHNPFDSKIEATYVFPLPNSAAVNEFVMTVGDRKIRGIIREREKAEQIYAAARAQGHVASLMTQERANIFTQKVANIEPGKQIDINIRYFNTLQYDDGAYEFVFPMVVGPRFNPPATTDGVGAVPRGARGASGQQTEVQYLAPNERSGHDISLALNISAGVDIEDVHSINHGVEINSIGETGRSVTLASHDTIPNKDFVLRYKVAGDQIKTAMLTHEDKHGKYFTVMLYPPAELEQVNRSPMEMVFVLDCSGSMSGKPIAQAKAAISHALQSLTPRDTFQIIRFSNNASQLGPEPVVATSENIQRGLQYLTSLNGSGGTHMIEGIKAALDFPHDEGRFRLVSFMTDGYIGNEQQILGTMYDKLGASRVFSFGVGNSTNRMLMNRMAILGRGAATYLSLNDDAVEVMDRFNRRISHPAMTDLAIDWGNMRVADVYPQRIPDLIVGRPVVLTGRFKGEPGTVKVNGRVDMEPASFDVGLAADGATGAHTGIAAVWARLKIKDMMNVATHAPEAAEEIKAAVTQTALAYNLMSSYTSFVAVDSLTKTEGGYGTTVAVPVPVPEGVKYETTVGGQGESIAN